MVINRTLQSGIRIVLEEIPYVQSIAIGIWVRAGAVDEPSEYAGISHFIEHMMFKGTGSRTAKQIATDIDKIGGQINAFTGKEATCYYVKSICDKYKEAADVLIDMLSDSLLDKEEMDKERMVICEEIKMTQDTPDELAHDTVTTLVFDGNPLGKSIIGTPESLEGIQPQVMRDYMAKEYTRDSIVISVAGNFDVEVLCQYFDEKLMGLLPSKETKTAEHKSYTPAYKTIYRDIEQSHICLATKAIPMDDDRYYALSILNNIMGGSMSSRFFQNIREEKGLAYSVYSMLGCYSNDGYYNIYAGVSHDKIQAAICAIREELDILGEKGIHQDELESSRAQLRASYVFGQENVAGRMFKNGKNTVLNQKNISPEEVIAGYDRVSVEDIEKVKSLICDFSSYSGAVVTRKDIDLESIMKGTSKL